jgi:hypothetical protein
MDIGTLTQMARTINALRGTAIEMSTAFGSKDGITQLCRATAAALREIYDNHSTEREKVQIAGRINAEHAANQKLNGTAD